MASSIDFQKVMNEIHLKICQDKNLGEVASYIPELSIINPNKFGVCIRTVDNKEYGVGDWQTKFSIQSIAKVLSLSFAYSIIGDKMWERVGVEPSGNPFNSLVQLETDNGIPRNPLLNAGAMVICDMLISETGDACDAFLKFVQKICSNNKVSYSTAIANSEKSVGFRNIALCNFIKSFGNIKNDPDKVLDFYFNMCSIEMSCQELGRTFMFLVDDNFRTPNNEQVLNTSQAKRIKRHRTRFLRSARRKGHPQATRGNR